MRNIPQQDDEGRLIGDYAGRGALMGAIVTLGVIVALYACAQGRHDELTSTQPYADFISSEYEVVADDLRAFGIYKSLDTRTLGHVTLVPRMRLSGPEVAFRKDIPKGSIIRILSAWRRAALDWSGVYYIVAVHDSDLPRDIPVRVELLRGNEGVGAELNPKVYRKLPRRQ